MAYTPHVLVSFGGSWSTEPAEIWECTIRLSGDGGGGVVLDEEGWLADVRAHLSTWFNTNANQMSNLATLKWLKCNHVGADGRYIDPTTTHVYDYPAAVAGGAGATSPGFCSLAFTWETGVARGRAHRGRMYPPNPTWPMDAHPFTVINTQRDANAAVGAALLTLLKNTTGAAGRKGQPIIASKLDGALHNITGCSSDSIMDVQRRRKNRAVGTRSGIVAA